MPDAGELDRRLAFQNRQLDANGARTGPWDEAGQVLVWARVDYLRGSEAAVGQRLAGVQPVTITVRDSVSTRAITNAWRAVNPRRPSEVFNITAAAPARERGFLDLMATSGAGVD